MRKAATVNPYHHESAQAEQRIHSRYATNLAVQLYWRRSTGQLQSAPGVIRDMSSGGFGIELGQPLEVGQALSVQTHKGALHCVARHVRTDGTKYFAGLEVISASDGSNHERSLKNLSRILAQSKDIC